MSILTVCLHQNKWCYHVSCTSILVQLTWQHQYISGTGPAAPIGKETLTFRKFKNSPDFFNVSSTNKLVQYKESQNVSSTTPIQLNVAYSISWRERKRNQNYSKMVSNFRDKRTLTTTMQAKPKHLPSSRPLLFLITHYL